MRDFRGIRVWEKGHALTLSIYQATKQFPNDEKFGLTSQMRRASASIPTNIAEGSGRHGDAELARFMQISMGSASELEYLLLLSHDLNLLNPQEYRQLTQQTVEVKKMLASFIKKLRNS
ncbi:MAG: four helix bundle protein [Chloroflexi bacterium]|nr:four helix bundle protein [Chloroflexota bacterium]